MEQNQPTGQQTKIKEIQLKEFHSKLWIQNQKKKMKDESIVFVLPNGKKVQ